jgi:hypothetical protein
MILLIADLLGLCPTELTLFSYFVCEASSMNSGVWGSETSEASRWAKTAPYLEATSVKPPRSFVN